MKVWWANGRKIHFAWQKVSSIRAKFGLSHVQNHTTENNSPVFKGKDRHAVAAWNASAFKVHFQVHEKSRVQWSAALLQTTQFLYSSRGNHHCESNPAMITKALSWFIYHLTARVTRAPTLYKPVRAKKLHSTDKMPRWHADRATGNIMPWSYETRVHRSNVLHLMSLCRRTSDVNLTRSIF